ncbi:unnamed protein product, partial [Scytosiphon promiscuus]
GESSPRSGYGPPRAGYGSPPPPPGYRSPPPVSRRRASPLLPNAPRLTVIRDGDGGGGGGSTWDGSEVGSEYSIAGSSANQRQRWQQQQQQQQRGSMGSQRSGTTASVTPAPALSSSKRGSSWFGSWSSGRGARGADGNLEGRDDESGPSGGGG